MTILLSFLIGLGLAGIANCDSRQARSIFAMIAGVAIVVLVGVTA